MTTGKAFFFNFLRNYFKMRAGRERSPKGGLSGPPVVHLD
jgi:hypothetical protein